MQEIIDIVYTYGVDTLLLALIINLLTGIIKIPIKILSAKINRKNINKYITLLPVIIGFILSSLTTGMILEPGVFWNARTPVLALMSSSLSLSIYAICEKFFGISDVNDLNITTTEEILNAISEFLPKEQKSSENMLLLDNDAENNPHNSDTEQIMTKKIHIILGREKTIYDE